MHKANTDEVEIYPQSMKGRGRYPASGGGISDGGRLLNEVPRL